MSKRKLALSVRKDLLDEVKKVALSEGKTLSSLVEEFFEFLALGSWVEELAQELGLGGLEPVSDQEIVSTRPRGLDASRVVRELRNGRGSGFIGLDII